MAISSNTLFHFTSQRDTLEKILDSKFLWPRYCTEYFWNGYRFSLPMMCLCDIPLSEISTHMNHYGNYGIGLSKDWAKEIKELSTIIYTRHNSLIYNKVCTILKKREKEECLSSEDIFILSRVKKYSGNTYCSPNGKRELVRNVRFYNEREWRFVPKNLLEDDIFIEKNQDMNPIQCNDERTKGNPTFEYSDIRYLIVKDDAERAKLIGYIDNFLDTKMSISERTILKSRILTSKQIREDF